MRSLTILCTAILSTLAAAQTGRQQVIAREFMPWDFHIHGNKQGPHARRSDDYLNDYSLRGRSVDPSKLGVDNVKQFSGYLDNNATDKHLFYWFFESRNDPKNDPVILWLSGGPGVDSITRVFSNMGPGRFTMDGKLGPNPTAWNSNASIIFLDQPVNTGFSYSESQTVSTIAAGKDVYALLTLFFEQHPEYRKQHFHITGASYAGHWVPGFAYEILSHPHRNINLKSISIGNGLTDPKTQFKAMQPMACGGGEVDAVLSPALCDKMKEDSKRCQTMIERCYETTQKKACRDATLFCEGKLLGTVKTNKWSIYDLRHRKGDPSNHPEGKYVQKFLKNSDVLATLGVERFHAYRPSSTEVMRAFVGAGDKMLPYQKFIPEILKKIPIMVYAGDKDYICNWLGVRDWTEQLEWSGKEEYNRVGLKAWKLRGKEVGKMKNAGNLSFVRVYDAGHSVPNDQPEAALDMMNSYLKWVQEERK
ncbi:hypothetical protein H072_2921 [Dactylellina haptotyla CBS 200.50]|uniref:carboxypeptidase C n=1 Tax=Dactylellina haptotyla (strain CBS 200.50) TaxID=1284197 RepID=S8AJL7_DACHA|nr:hypothetical protein H072_2921 [Dactylellina haptotyla CBS 200.50]